MYVRGYHIFYIQLRLLIAIICTGLTRKEVDSLVPSPTHVHVEVKINERGVWWTGHSVGS
jgi:hypothetical protein